ncbi:hypothetical protein P0136_05645 [Lentisphaerota bacterium ZTH]|nr:hypothetical protein JYG24_03245 [Lentisphaerota bacterium]WET07474.1 hypothetical protein P0136_05645 [Lentisphaerota bacterium ZTH]
MPGGGKTTLISDGGITVTGQIISTGYQVAGGISQMNHLHGGVKVG